MQTEELSQTLTGIEIRKKIDQYKYQYPVLKNHCKFFGEELVRTRGAITQALDDDSPVLLSRIIRRFNRLLKTKPPKQQIHKAKKLSIEPAEYRAWANMKQRCNNPKDKDYKDYGGRGIKVCDRWLHNFENFLADMGKRPSPQHSIDRYPNNDGNYEPSNCRWATQIEQAQNRRKSHKVVA